jgi:hypothetical protein
MKLNIPRLSVPTTLLAMILTPLAVLAVPQVHLSGAAAAAGKRAGGVIHVYEVVPSLTSSSAEDIITGAITDYGKDHEGVGGNGALNKFVLAKGSFVVNVAKLADQPMPRVDPSTCSFTSRVTSSIPIVRGTGTGSYRGISGTVKVTIIETGILRRTTSGRCDESPSATPVAGVSWTTGSGTVSFS